MTPFLALRSAGQTETWNTKVCQDASFSTPGSRDPVGGTAEKRRSHANIATLPTIYYGVENTQNTPSNRDTGETQLENFMGQQGIDSLVFLLLFFFNMADYREGCSLFT